MPLDSIQGQQNLALPAVADLDSYDLDAGASAASAAAHAACLSSAISLLQGQHPCLLMELFGPTLDCITCHLQLFCLSCSTLKRLYGVCFALQSKVDWLQGRTESLLDSSNAGALMGYEPLPAASCVLKRQVMVLTSAQQALHLPQQNKFCTCLSKTTLAMSARQILNCEIPMSC